MILISKMLILAGHSHIDKITGLAKCCYFMIYIWNYAFLFLCSIRFVSFPKIISYNVDSLIVSSPFRLQNVRWRIKQLKSYALHNTNDFYIRNCRGTWKISAIMLFQSWPLENLQTENSKTIIIFIKKIIIN
jgi:hypothetical protein